MARTGRRICESSELVGLIEWGGVQAKRRRRSETVCRSNERWIKHDDSRHDTRRQPRQGEQCGEMEWTKHGIGKRDGCGRDDWECGIDDEESSRRIEQPSKRVDIMDRSDSTTRVGITRTRPRRSEWIGMDCGNGTKLGRKRKRDDVDEL